MPNCGSWPFRLVQRLGAVHRRGADHFERMEAGFLQQLHLVDVAEAPRVVDVGRIVADRDAAAHLLVVVQQPEPDLVEVAPGDLVAERPVEEVRAVVLAVRRVEVHQRRQRVLVVPVGVAHAHHVAARRIRRHRRIEDRASLRCSCRYAFHSGLPGGWIMFQSRATWPKRNCSSL